MDKFPILHTAPAEFWTDERCFITEVLNHADCPDMSLAIGRVEAGVTTQLHTLTVEETYCVQKGEGVIEIDGQRAALGPGDSVCISPGQAQRITNTGAADLVFALVCRPRFVPETYKNLETLS